MDAIRNGNFTSSEIVALTKKATAITYIEECNMERRLGRSLTDEVNARPIAWGRLNEKRVHDLLGTDYKLCSSETLSHPKVNFWKGSPDFIRYFQNPTDKTVVDAKCPKTLKSFCRLVDAWEKGGIEGIRKYHRDGEKFYWQLVSNGCITGCGYGELIVYVPYKSELEAIRDMATMYDGPDQFQYKWIASAPDDELPFLIEGGYYKNINKFRFEIPVKDKIYLHELVIEAGRELITMNEPITA